MIGICGSAIIYNCQLHYNNGSIYRMDYTRLDRCKTIQQLYETEMMGGKGHHTRRYRAKYLNERKTFSGTQNVFKPSKIKKIVYLGEQPVYEIITKSGNTIRSALLQRFLCYDFSYRQGVRTDFLPLAYLTTGHRLAFDPNKWKSGIRWEEIDDIKACHDEPTYNLELLPEQSNYIANGFVASIL